METETHRIDFHGGPADGQYRMFPDPPSTINWLTADGVVIYTLTASGYVAEGE